MKKIFLFIVFGSFIAFGQNGADKSYLPNTTPPNVEAFNFTKFGNVEADEFNGKVNNTIPLLSYKVGNVELPINLTYNGAGVKLNDVPTQVGINFNLEVGGVITREIKGIADEIASQRLWLSDIQLNNLNQGDCTSGAQQLKGIVEADDYDKEKDVFIVKFLNNYASFYFNENFIPVYLDNSNELKIEIVGSGSTNYLKFINSYSFLVTTNDGTKFYFGGENNTEGTSLRTFVNGAQVSETGGVNSFYLKEIETINGEKIFLEYESTATYNYVLDSNYSKTLLTFIEVNTANECTPAAQSFSTSVTQTFIYCSPIYLKKIHSNKNDIEVVFNRSSFNAVKYKKVLNSIDYKSNNTIIKKIEFEYNGITPTLNPKRFFLKKIKTNNASSTLTNIDEYSFVYNDEDALPTYSPYSIDYLGYFNNKNNDNLFPFFDSESQIGIADRESNFYYATKGALTKIIYPTKGYTEFEYEQYPVVEEDHKNYSLSGFISPTNLSEGINEDVQINNVVFTNGYYVKSHDELPKTVDVVENPYVIFNKPIFTNQNVKIKINFNTTNFYNSNPTIKLKIIDISNNSTSQQFEFHANSEFIFEFLRNHLYKIELDLVSWPNKYSEDFASYFNASFTIMEGYKSEKGVGIRIKNIKDYSLNSPDPIIKRYYYKPIHKLNDLSFENQYFSNVKYRTTNSFGYKVCSLTESEFGAGWPLLFPYNSTTLNSNYNFIDNITLGNFYNNKYITISYGGDNFENGGIQKTFSLVKKYPINTLNIPSLNEFDLSNANITLSESVGSYNPIMGKLINEKTYKKANNGLEKINEVVYNYEPVEIMQNSINLIYNELFSTNQLSSLCSDVNKIISNYSIQYYHDYLYDFKLRSNKKINYIDPVPVALTAIDPLDFEDTGEVFPTQDQIESSFKKIITTQNFEYGALKGLPTVITTNTSDSSIVNKTVNTYVDTAASLPNIPSNQIAIYPSLISQNRVGSPIQVQQFQNTELLSTQRTLFNNFTVNNVTKILPEKIQIGKGDLIVNPLEDKAIFYNYDQHFNPVVMGYANASKTRYMYNSEGLVVAKIENYTGTSTAFPLVIGNVDNTNCALQTQYPGAYVTVFKYNLITKKLIQITDPRCQNSFYEYDDLHRLKFIKDHNGSIVKEFDQQFKPQN